MIYDLDYKNVLQDAEKATSPLKTLWFWKKTYKNAMQFTKFVLPNLYFGVLNCENKFHKNLFCNEFFLQGNPRRIFIYSIYIFICSIYILNYILYIIYIYTYIIYIYMYIYIYNKERKHNHNTWCWWVWCHEWMNLNLNDLPKFCSVMNTVFQIINVQKL